VRERAEQFGQGTETLLPAAATWAPYTVCEQVVRSMVADGLSEQSARARVYVVDLNGLLTTDRPDRAGQRTVCSGVTSQPRRRDMVCAQRTRASTWSEVSVARHSNDHG
jgi:Malic enzyme, NAD binding domain